MMSRPVRTTRILLVDDERPNLDLMSRVFNMYETMTVQNGKDALAALAQHRFDVVLLDVMMPGMSGLDVLQIIRQQHAAAELPVILVSALSERRSVTNGLRLGANDYIIKPIDVDDVQARVNTQIQLKRYVDERRQFIFHLEQINARMQRFMQIASHDLKNPVQNLKLFIALMRRKHADDENTQHLLTSADTSLNTMTAIIEEFLSTENVHEDVSVQIQPLEARKVITQVLQEYTPIAQEKDIALLTDDLGGMVLADAKRLKQVVANLVSNAIKFSPPHSRVELSTLVQDGVWQLVVADSGPGIAPEDIERLFMPFAQLRNKPTAGEPSTGLGLWIVREMMLLQGGDVGVYCPESGGSHFWIQLPAA